MQVAIYTDAVYRRVGARYSTDETFVAFAADLRAHVDALTLLGRCTEATEPAHYAIAQDIRVVELPHYPALTRVPAVLAAAARSARLCWRALDDVDAVWLLGPHPMAIVFAAIALVRRKGLVLGVRQHLPSHQRTRHPGQPLIHVAAQALEATWHVLAHVAAVTVVGADLAHRYRRSKRVVDISISLTSDEDLVPVDVALARHHGDEVELLSVGRLDAEKNPLLLADIMAELRDRGHRWRLTVCGDGQLAADLAERLQAFGLEKQVDLLGYVPLDALASRYRRAHALVHVSWTEGVPQVLFEAFAAGLPVAATDVGGVRAAAAGAAELVPPGDAAAMADAVERIIADGARRERLVRAGAAIAAETTGARQRDKIAAVLAGAVR